MEHRVPKRGSVFAIGSGPALLGCALACLPAGPARGGTAWPTLHKDYQRSGYTEEVVTGPYERKWYRDFHDEMIATRVEAIVAEGKCFVGTFAGRLRALSVRDGKTLWTFQAAGPIGASPCYAAGPSTSSTSSGQASEGQGKLYFGADEGFATGRLYCLNAADGSVVWKYDAGAGIWVSPACDPSTGSGQANVYFGDRAGVFHAVSAADGKRAWTFRAGGMILKPASLSPDGKRIVFGAEDMHVYCLDPGGKLLWKSAKLPGLSLRDQAPTIWRGLAIVRTNPADAFHLVLGRNGDVLKRIQQAIPRGDEDKVLLDKWNDLMMHPTPRRRKAEQEGIVRYLRENPHDRTFHALRLKDGSEPWIAPVFYTAGLHNPPTPPTFHPRTGELYTFYRSALSYYLRGVRRYNALARIRREDGRVDFVFPERRHDVGRAWHAMPMIGDETQALSIMGDWLVDTHQGDIGALNLRTEKVLRIWVGRDTYGGIFGPHVVPGGFQGARELARKGYLTGMANEWHGPDRAICAVAEGRLFWVVGSQVVCLAGPDVPKTPTGGRKAPAMIKKKVRGGVGGNLSTASAGGFEEGLKVRTIKPEEIRPFLERPPSARRKHATDPPARALRRLLDAEVLELVQAPPWAPFVVELGISGEERHFWRTGEAIQILALALPHLSPAVRAKAVKHLDGLFDAGCPLGKPAFDAAGAKRREAYDLGPGMRAFAARRLRCLAGIEDLYGLWAYGHYADRWSKIIPRAEAVGKLLAAFRKEPASFDHRDPCNDSAERLNRQIAGVLAAARILAKAGDDVASRRAMTDLARLATLRVHHERADTELIRATGGRQGHAAKVPRYVGLVPELTGLLGQRAGKELARNVRGLMAGLPVWYHAFGERMIGGENYISPPHLARGLFAALADGVGAPAEELAARLDQPWCRADLYYIEKVSAILRRLDAAQ
ncbi:MAG TPA: PQQ-binding-like beta-propeller repeat protein [Phycisphaerae bacterium]|nr:PQQ-binding-like beta-propeller repeat protein [Phycisphaerae bacterium]